MEHQTQEGEVMAADVPAESYIPSQATEPDMSLLCSVPLGAAEFYMGTNILLPRGDSRCCSVQWCAMGG